MSVYYFDLKDGIPVRDREGLECINDEEAIARGQHVARRLRTERPDIAGKGHYISVVHEDGSEIYRAPIDPQESPQVRH